MTLLKYITLIAILMTPGCKMSVKKNENKVVYSKNEILKAERFKLEKKRRIY